MAETIDRDMDAGGWAVGTVALVILGGYCGAIERPENLEKVVVNYVTFEFLLILVAGAKSVCNG